VNSRGWSLSRLAGLAALACIAGLVSIPSASAAAKTQTSKPLVSTYAWYWEEAEAHDVEGPAGTATVDSNNEYCPQIPGGGLGNVTEETCAEGRMPVRIAGGDYESPNQLSAVIFDTLTTIPLGAKVEKFTATFEEAKAGCREKETAPSGQQCEASAPANVESHELQACLVTELFGEGAARPYREVPRHECTNSDPTAKRKKKGDTFTWTFDLTEYAQKWADGDVITSAILLTGVEPKDTGPQDNWRVTLLGPVDDGITTLAKFTPPPAPVIDPLLPTGGGGGGTPGTPAIPGTPGTPGTPATAGTPTTTGAGGSSATGGAGASGAAEPGDAKAPVEATDEAIAAEPTAADSGPPGGGLPWYGWLALLAGIGAFSVLRTIVLDGAAGVRPDGVLAQIQRLNAERRGGAAASAGAQPGLWMAFVGMTAGIRSSVSNVASKVSNSKALGKATGLVGKLKPGKRS
jgi:hypothetical protein